MNLRGPNDWTPLHAAGVRGNLEAIRILLETGADRTIRTRIDGYPTPEEEARNLKQESASNLIWDYSTPSSSTSNTRVAFGGMTPPAPRAP